MLETVGVNAPTGPATFRAVGANAVIVQRLCLEVAALRSGVWLCMYYIYNHILINI